MDSSTTETLYSKYGGTPTVSSVVHQFYVKVLRSELLQPYFEGVNMEKLMRHQIDLFSFVMGAPIQFDLTVLKRSHAHLKISNAAFDEVAELLQETLEEVGMSAEDVGKMMTIVGSTRGDIVHSA
jgi:hemoglobin